MLIAMVGGRCMAPFSIVCQRTRLQVLIAKNHGMAVESVAGTVRYVVPLCWDNMSDRT